MKKILVVLLTLVFVVAFSVVSFGLTTPTVTAGHGVLTGLFVSGNGTSGFLIGGEYGVTGNIAVGAELGTDWTKVYGKYEFNPSIALEGGVLSIVSGNVNPFLGINAGTAINKDFAIMGQVDLASVSGVFIFAYEVGVKYNIIKQLDIRGGIRGLSVSGYSANAIEVGVGFKF